MNIRTSYDLNVTLTVTLTMTNNTATVPFVTSFVHETFSQGPNQRMEKCKVCFFNTEDGGSSAPDLIRPFKVHTDT